MRSKNTTAIDCQLLLMALSMAFSTKNVQCVCVSYLLAFFTDKLTGALPILNPGVPLPKVAAHVTGVVSSTESPTAEGVYHKK